MRHALCNYLVEFWQDDDGQSITEYGAVIAFVGVLFAMAFYLSHGTLFATVSQSYSSCSDNLNSLNSYVSNGS